ncbi:VOC family protein [Thalassospira xiamenensis]|uniref:Catechol 2,3-dioxygenase n=1 Tax=Thalassospira xiamenensis TaxID=220697 RepID=A0A285RSE9_9PROT|nr:VOC family protein [Thalassospira xiamenensis]SOB95227.1 Catechol 2,3-dioxygenase [Thalassospira xiamenensis]
MIITAATPLLNVAEINRSIDFYRLLGFEVVARTLSDLDEQPVWAMLEAGDGDTRIRLMLAAHGGVSHEERRMRPSFAGLVWYLECNDVDGMFDTINDAGFKPEPVTELEDGTHQFFVRDPDGYEIAVTEPNGYTVG